MGRRLSPFRAALLVCLLLCLGAVPAFAENQPLITQYVDCVTDAKGMILGSRTMLTPVYNSQRGGRAYGVVIAKYSAPGACDSTTTIYMAEAAGKFRAAFQQGLERLPDGSIYDGNGIEAIRWSPSGERLLVEVSQWTWGTDETWNTKYILITPGEEHARKLPVQNAIERQFGTQCIRLIKSKGWLDTTRIELEVSPTSYVDEEGVPDPTPSCVLKPTEFSFDVVSGALRQSAP